MSNWKWVAASLAAGVALAGAAGAAVTVLGEGPAGECSKAALAGKSDLASERDCSLALDDQLMDITDRAGTFVNRGIMKLRRGEFAASRTDFDAAVTIAPRMGEAWVNRGAMFVGIKQYKAGLDDINHGLALGAKEPEKAYFNRALAYEGLDDEKDAYFDYRKALELKPGWILPQKELLRFHVSQQ
jgi:tetratricopeptide (TPR) repeat protein